MSDSPPPPPSNLPAITPPRAPVKKPMHPLAAVGVAIAVIIGTIGVGALGLIGLIAYTCSK